MSKTELQTEWVRRIANFKASGQTQTKWCVANDMKIHQLKYWLKRIENSHSTQESPTKWVPVTIEEPSEKLDETLQIKVGQAIIDVKPGFNQSLLVEVVKTLKMIC